MGALSRLFSFIPYMPAGVAEYDTDQEVQLMLEGKCTALTEYTGLAQRIDDPASSKVVGKITAANTPKQEIHGPAIGTFIASVASGAKNPEGAVQFLEWFTSSETQMEFARKYGGAAVTGSALNDPEAVQKHRWLPAIAEAVNTSVQKPRTPDEPKMEDILGTHLNEALVEAIAAKANYDAIAKKHLTAAAGQISNSRAAISRPRIAHVLSLTAKAVESRESRVQRLRLAAVPYLLLLPAMLALAAISLYPTIDGIDASLHKFRYGLDQGFAGTDNFAIVYGDATFWQAILTTVMFVTLAVAIETLLGLMLALVVARELRFASLIRVTLILPMTIAPVVVGVIWRLLYASDIGVVNPLFEMFGFEAPNILAHPLTAFLGLIVVDVWEWTPLLFLIILAGLHSLPQDPIEAARVDGASRIQTFFHHTLPLLKPVLLVAVVLRTIDAVGTFDQIYVLTKGGPGTATQLISIYAYNTAFLFNQYGRAMAMLISLLAFLLLLMVAAVRLMRRSSEIGE